jgi:hypothetical protein
VRKSESQSCKVAIASFNVPTIPVQSLRFDVDRYMTASPSATAFSRLTSIAARFKSTMAPSEYSTRIVGAANTLGESLRPDFPSTS